MSFNQRDLALIFLGVISMLTLFAFSTGFELFFDGDHTDAIIIHAISLLLLYKTYLFIKYLQSGEKLK